MNSKQLQVGFTLIELMVVVIITSIIAAIAIPSMVNIVAQQRVQNRADLLLSLFQFSRSEALRTGKPVLLCSTLIRSGTAVPNGCTGWSPQQQGIMAFNDNNLDGQYNPRDNNNSENDSLLRTVHFNQNGANVIVNVTSATCADAGCQNLAGGKTRFVGFMPNGIFGWESNNESTDSGNNVSNSTKAWDLGQGSMIFVIADAKNQAVQERIIISPSGRAMICSNASGGQKPALCNADIK